MSNLTLFLPFFHAVDAFRLRVCSFNREWFGEPSKDPLQLEIPFHVES